MCILKLENVSYCYDDGTKDVLKNININFEKGKLYVITGKSGSGKSTLLSLISGLDICSQGFILYQRENLCKIDRDVYRAQKIGVIFQGFNLLTNATVIDNIILSMNISKMKENNKKEYGYQLLENVGINKETANRKVLKLSGGEQQRVAIARALSHHPDLIIADEPTGNLDSDTEKNIMDILSSLAHKSKKCIIVVTHSANVAKYADEIWGLNKGVLNFVKKNK